MNISKLFKKYNKGHLINKYYGVTSIQGGTLNEEVYNFYLTLEKEVSEKYNMEIYHIDGLDKCVNRNIYDYDEYMQIRIEFKQRFYFLIQFLNPHMSIREYFEAHISYKDYTRLTFSSIKVSKEIYNHYYGLEVLFAKKTNKTTVYKYEKIEPYLT